ncbi:MAG: uroporphyrinogen-III synthase [Microthrixaceae bacterium]
MVRQAHGALTGWVVGVTADRRHEEQIELLRRRGARVVHAPTMRTRPLGPDDELGEAIEAVIEQRPEVIVLSTGIGVRGWLEAAEALGRADELRAVIGDAQLVARGPKAAGAAASEGWQLDWQARTATATEVVEHLRDTGIDGRRVTALLDGRSAPVLAEQLRTLGAEVVAVPVYRWELPDDVEPVLRLRIEALTSTVFDEQVERLAFDPFRKPESSAGPATHVDRCVPAADELGQQHRKSFIGAGHTPPAVARRVNGVLQPRSTSPRRCCGGLDHQPGPDQLGEVLADGVVVQAEVIGQFGDTDRCVGVGEVLEDRMAGRVAERPSLDLQRRHRCHVDDGSGGLKSAITNDTGRMLANPLVPASEIDSCRPVVDLGHFPLRGGS